MNNAMQAGEMQKLNNDCRDQDTIHRTTACGRSFSLLSGHGVTIQVGSLSMMDDPKPVSSLTPVSLANNDS
jgi:hypothetical protein